jgi:hypothetical protein
MRPPNLSQTIRRYLRGVKVLAGVLAALALAAPGAAATQAASGVSGRVVARDASARGCIRPPCYKPVAGVTVTFVRGSETLRATSDRLGRFRLLLDPGTWTVRAPGLVAPAHARSVRVPSGRVMPLTIVVARPTALR